MNMYSKLLALLLISFSIDSCDNFVTTNRNELKLMSDESGGADGSLHASLDRPGPVLTKYNQMYKQCVSLFLPSDFLKCFNCSLDDLESFPAMPFSNNNPFNDRNDAIMRRKKRNLNQLDWKTTNKTRIIGFRVEDMSGAVELSADGAQSVLANSEFSLRLFGVNFYENLTIAFTHIANKYDTACHPYFDDTFIVVPTSITTFTALVRIDKPLVSSKALYLCIVRPSSMALSAAGESEGDRLTETMYVHQGDSVWLSIETYNEMLPKWLCVCIIVVCLLFSSLLSGLNLGLMSLDKTDLQILCNTGSEKEKQYAKMIFPVRETGNYLLCSILLGNVLVNSIFTILLDSLTSGIVAVSTSTLIIVTLGEIFPQAVCSRYGIVVGAKTIYFTKAIMVLTSPLSYPLSKFLDFILKEEIAVVYTRERLKELIKMSTDNNQLDKEEVNIISGALELRKKSVKDIMTHIQDVFMIDIDSVLDFELLSEIFKSGYSRVPIYENDKQNFVSILYMKELTFVDPDDRISLRSHCQFYEHKCFFVFEDTKLDVLFKQFKEGNKGHMAFIQRITNVGESDPFYEVIGIVTLEDIIEELIQEEIVDETDVFTDNRSKRRRNAHKLRQDFTIFLEKHHKSFMSPQLNLATFQFLSTSIDAFKSEYISETILHRLLKQDIIFHIKKSKDKNDEHLIYEQGKSADYFVLILEGRVEVRVGKESLVFQSGPFTYFGTQALTQNIGSVDSPCSSPNAGSVQSLNIESAIKSTFIPDYTVKTISEVIYIQINRSKYMQAKRATLMERSHTKGSVQTDAFDLEVNKMFNCFDDDDTSQKTPLSMRSNSEKGSRKPSSANYNNSHNNQSSFEQNGATAIRTSPSSVAHSLCDQSKDDLFSNVSLPAAPAATSTATTPNASNSSTLFNESKP